MSTWDNHCHHHLHIVLVVRSGTYPSTERSHLHRGTTKHDTTIAGTFICNAALDGCDFVTVAQQKLCYDHSNTPHTTETFYSTKHNESVRLTSNGAASTKGDILKLHKIRCGHAGAGKLILFYLPHDRCHTFCYYFSDGHDKISPPRKTRSRRPQDPAWS